MQWPELLKELIHPYIVGFCSGLERDHILTKAQQLEYFVRIIARIEVAGDAAKALSPITVSQPHNEHVVRLNKAEVVEAVVLLADFLPDLMTGSQ